MTGTYSYSQFDRDNYSFTFFGSDADSARKGWRSIGCCMIPASRLAANIKALEDGGSRLETRSHAEMAAVIRQARAA